MEILSKFVETFLLALAPVLASLVVAFVAVKVKALWAEFNAVNPEVGYWLEEAAKMAVNAAEQAGMSELIDDKLAYAMDIAEKYLKENYNLVIDLDLIAAAIEAEVMKSQKEFAEVAKLRSAE